MNLYLKVWKALAKLVDGKNPSKAYEMNRRIEEAHFCTRMNAGWYRNDGF